MQIGEVSSPTDPQHLWHSQDSPEMMPAFLKNLASSADARLCIAWTVSGHIPKNEIQSHCTIVLLVVVVVA